MHGMIEGPSDGRIKGTIVTQTCSCGETFTYRRGVKPRTMCLSCLHVCDQKSMKATNRARTVREGQLPKAWTPRERRQYVTVEKAVKRLIPMLYRLPVDRAEELIGHLLVASLIRPPIDHSDQDQSAD